MVLQHLYKIERLCDEANLPADERKAKRNELSRPIMEAMKLWMETEGIKYSESSQIGKAITYAYTLWDNMMHYLDDRTSGCLARQRKKSRKPRPERTFRDDPFRQENLYNNKEEDCHVCPMGQHMTLVGVTRKVSDNGFASYSYKYRAQRCTGCPLRSQCYKSKAEQRTIEVNHNLNEHKRKAREMLTSEEGLSTGAADR